MIELTIIVHLKFKLSNYKATFVPREHAIYPQIKPFSFNAPSFTFTQCNGGRFYSFWGMSCALIVKLSTGFCFQGKSLCLVSQICMREEMRYPKNILQSSQ